MVRVYPFTAEGIVERKFKPRFAAFGNECIRIMNMFLHLNL